MQATAGAFEEVLGKLKGLKRAKYGWDAFCPAHDDKKKQSMTVRISPKGDLLLKCQKGQGCTIEEICVALGIEKKDLYGPRADTRTASERHHHRRRLWKRPGQKPKEQDMAGKIVATYDYKDADGTLLYQIVRFDPKDFRPKRPVEGGKWEWNLEGVKRVLYRLPELMTTENRKRAVLLCEGEKDADRLASLGLLATCNPGGALKWDDGFTESLTDRNVYIIPDFDPEDEKRHTRVGAVHALRVARAIYDKVASVRILWLPAVGNLQQWPENSDQKWDVSDWLDHGGTKEQLLAFAKGTPAMDHPPTEADEHVTPDTEMPEPAKPAEPPVQRQEEATAPPPLPPTIDPVSSWVDAETARVQSATQAMPEGAFVDPPPCCDHQPVTASHPAETNGSPLSHVLGLSKVMDRAALWAAVRALQSELETRELVA